MKPALAPSLIGVLVLAVLAVIPSGAAPGCTQSGTGDRDVMAGTSGRDVMCALAGNDYVHGGQGPDLVLGGPGPDTLVGGVGDPDRVRGQGGDDKVFVVDNRGGDKAVGGAGNDQCFVDESDIAKGCERVFRGHSITVRQYLSLQRAFFGGLTLAEMLIEDAASPAPTVTVTVTAPFPPCTPPPASPPPPC